MLHDNVKCCMTKWHVNMLQVVSKLKRNLRKNMEDEIEELQDEIVRGIDDTHFRELDIQAARQRLNMGKYFL